MTTSTFSIRLTKSEKITLEKMAILEGKNLSDYVKSKIFSWKELTMEEVAKEKVQQSEIIISHMEKHMELILKTLLTNNGILRLTLGKDLPESDKENLRAEVKGTVEKLFIK